jgi:hypothetical protein
MIFPLPGENAFLVALIPLFLSNKYFFSVCVICGAPFLRDYFSVALPVFAIPLALFL